jgi:putative SOS response-associated peptidase YedK
MCGRFTLAAPSEELVEAFSVPLPDFEIRPRYNVAPGQDALVVGEDRRGRRTGRLRWGLVPAHAREPGKQFVNARGETVGRTPSFRGAFLQRRCLVPADGFYEWRRETHGKTPFLFRPVAGGLLAFAAVWEHWEGSGHPPRDGFAILTVAANEDVAPVHDRMPALVRTADFHLWLDRSSAPERLQELLVPAPAGTLRSHRVSQRVNSVSADDAGLVEPA